ncbi:hypothetical protein MKX03_018937 [Papaver bracteatum]|nr:hypothetical protein MKX03_018937 [Papaver bracteatum]
MINTNFLSSSSSSRNIRTTQIRNAIENLPAGAPPEPPSSGRFSWILWTLLPIIFPIFKKKLSPLLLLKKKLDTAVDAMDDGATLIEVIGEEAVDLTDKFENKATVKLAILAKGLIHKVLYLLF